MKKFLNNIYIILSNKKYIYILLKSYEQKMRYI